MSLRRWLPRESCFLGDEAAAFFDPFFFIGATGLVLLDIRRLCHKKNATPQ